MNLPKPMFFVKSFVALAFLLLCNFVYAQDEGSESAASDDEEYVAYGLAYGAKIGAVVSEFTNGQPHTGVKLGATVGGFVEFYFNDMIAIHADVAYFQQGGSYVQFKDDSRFGATDNFLTRNVKDAEVILHNVYIPLQAKIMPFADDMLPKFLIGPYADINFLATERYQRTGIINGDVYVTATGEDVVTDQYEMLQFGAVAGVQFEFPFRGDMKLLVTGAYKYGITPVKKSHSYIDFNEVSEDMTSNAFTLTLGVKL